VRAGHHLYGVFAVTLIGRPLVASLMTLLPCLSQPSHLCRSPRALLAYSPLGEREGTPLAVGTRQWDIAVAGGRLSREAGNFAMRLASSRGIVRFKRPVMTSQHKMGSTHHVSRNLFPTIGCRRPDRAHRRPAPPSAVAAWAADRAG
jgi:hypothetical protein